jgi:flagellar biosynthesis/type III secretory pathway protein FliH
VVVRVHPDDLPVVEALRARIGERAGVTGGFTVTTDVEVGRGGCVVESELGRIDARVETKLAALARAVGVDAPGGS